MRPVYSIIIFLSLVFASCEGYARTIRIKCNIPLQEQLVEAETTYLIKGRADLKGEILTIPANSTLKFKRKGILYNGTICGTNTLITGKPTFDGIHLQGTFVNDEFLASWCTNRAMSDYIADVMNLSCQTTVVIDKDITLLDNRKEVSHLNLKGRGKMIINSDRYYITYGGCDIRDLKFKWTKGPVQEPKDNYSAVVIYHDLLQKDTTVTITITNVHADGGRYCSYFMKQYKSSIEPKLRIENHVLNSTFDNFTRGAIWTCGGTGEVINCKFEKIGYETTTDLLSVYPLRLGYSNRLGYKAKAVRYLIKDCLFNNIVGSYNPENDGRELHGLLAYGDSIIVQNNSFLTLSTSFSKPTDPGMDSEMLYIKGSHNVIEGNIFTNGSGALSDGVVTLKTKETEDNQIYNNRFLQAATAGKFIYLGGRYHVVDGNVFKSTYSNPTIKVAYVIYLNHHEEDVGKESVLIQNNTFELPSTTRFMAVYANSWGDITVANNHIFNPTMLLKCNKRQGLILIENNVIEMADVQGESNDIFIEIGGSEKTIAKIADNEIRIHNSHTGRLINGSKYKFANNNLSIKEATLNSLLRGTSSIEASDNTIHVSEGSIIDRASLVGEGQSDRITVQRNNITGKQIKQLLSK